MDVCGLEELVRAFEEGTLPRARWGHHEHVLVAVWYLERGEGVARIVKGIQAYNASHGIAQMPDGGYHDTLTRFLSAGIEAFLRALPEGVGVAARADAAARAFGAMREDVLTYYSREVIGAWEARTGWVAPDVGSMAAWREECRRRAVRSGAT